MIRPTDIVEPPEILHGFVQFIKEMPEPLPYTVTTWPEAGFQRCPKCNGEGRVLAMAKGVSSFASDFCQCPVCLGRMIINCKTGKPPET